MIKTTLARGLPLVLSAFVLTTFAAPAARNAEVQINLCATPDAAARSLQLEPMGAAFEAWYFETADLALFRQGVLFRLRLKAHGAELTLKVANQDCIAIAPVLLPPRVAKCEYDVHGDHVAGAVSITTSLDDEQVNQLSTSPAALTDLLSAAQVAYLRDRDVLPLAAPLLRLGPVRIQGYRRKGDAFVVEAWQLPAGQPYLEISQKTSLANAAHVHEQLTARLGRNDIDVCADQGSQAGAKLRQLLRAD